MIRINPEIFKAYDIRGIYGQDFDENLSYKLGIFFVEMIKKEIGRDKIFLVAGSDMRLSSPVLKENLILGMIDGGADVIDIGLASTPTFYFAVANFKYDGGILVSASHNPKEYNGFKLVRSKAVPVSKDTGIFKLRDIILTKNVFKKNKNQGKVIFKNDILQEQIKHDLKFGKLQKIKSFKIVIDPANAMGSQYFEEFFKNFSTEIIKMNWKLDGNFPAHEADPFKYENIKDLCHRVITEKADLGIATDGDGDRIFFIDNKGIPVEPGITRAILCKIFLEEKPGVKIAYDIRPGRITYDIIVENGGIPVVTQVGHSLIKEKMIKENIWFAGESSGHFFLNMGDEGCYEIPLIVTLKILEELTISKQSFSEYIKPYKRYFHSGEINSRVINQRQKIEEIKIKYQDGKQNDLDGITVEYDDYWFNVRGSNTEPLLRLNVEARTQEVMEQKRDELLQLIRN